VLRGCAASSEPLFGQAAIDIVFSDVSEADIQDHLFPFARVEYQNLQALNLGLAAAA
jgi:hypothetical protein